MIIRPSTRIVIQSSLAELLKSFPQDKITVKQIVDNCGMSVRSFYNNFSDKNEAVNSIWVDAITPFLNAPLDEWYTHSLNYVVQNKDMFKNMLSYTGQNNYAEIYYKIERSKLMMHMNPKVLESRVLYEQYLIGVEYMIRENLSIVNAWINMPNLDEYIQSINEAFNGLWNRFAKTWPAVVLDNLEMKPVNVERDTSINSHDT